MQLRPIRYEELAIAAELDARAFRVDAAPIRASWEGNSRFSWRDVLAVEKDGELVSMLVVLPMDLWLGGAPLKTAAIASVAVPPEQRRRGLAKFMMRETHARFRAAGTHVAILYPFAFSFYRSVGYEVVEFRHDYRVPPANIPLYTERLRVRLAKPDDWAGVHAVYDRHLRQRGGIQRSEAVWRERFHDRDAELAVYVDDQGISGYVHYEFKKVNPSGADAPSWIELLVREMVAQSGAAERGLLGYLAAQQEQVKAVHVVRAPDEPLAMALTEPMSYPDRLVEFVMRVAFQGTPGLMLRILDVPGTLAARQYPAQVTGEISLAVQDAEQPEAGPWRVRFAGGRANLTPLPPSLAGKGENSYPPPFEGEGLGEGSPVSTDVATLSALFTGTLKASQAERMGRLTGDAAALAVLDAAFATPPLIIPRTDWF